MASEPLLRIVDLHKRFGALEVLSGIDLEVARGEKVSIIGPSGSGKTTLLRCINYLEKPSSGRIYIDGTLIGERPSNGGYVHLSDRELAKERQEIGFVFQRFNLFPHLTALDNVTIAPRKVLGLSRAEAEARGREMLEKVGLGHKIGEYPERLSGGQSCWPEQVCPYLGPVGKGSVWREPLWAWHSFVAHANAMRRIGESIQSRGAGSKPDWEMIIIPEDRSAEHPLARFPHLSLGIRQHTHFWRKQRCLLLFCVLGFMLWPVPGVPAIPRRRSERDDRAERNWSSGSSRIGSYSARSPPSRPSAVPTGPIPSAA